MEKEKEVSTEVKITQFIDRAWRPFVSVLGLAVVGGGVYLAYGSYTESQEREAQEELFGLMASIDDIQEKLLEEEADLPEPKGKKTAKKDLKKPKVEKNPQILDEKFGSSLESVKGFIGGNRYKKASYMAAIQSADLATEYKDYERAEKFLRLVLGQPAKKDVFYGLLHAQLGRVLMNQKKYEEATVELKKITQNETNKFFHAHALLWLGASYLELGDYDQAQSALGRVETEFSKTQAATKAKSLKKLLALRRAKNT